MRSSARLAVALILLLSGNVSAQSKKKATKTEPKPSAAPAPMSTRQLSEQCEISVKKAWFNKQSTWFNDAGHPWSNDTLRAAMLEASGLPAFVPAPVALGYEFEGRTYLPARTTDSMVGVLSALARKPGAKFPDKSSVGAAGVQALFILAHRDTAFGRMALQHMKDAGPNEALPSDVATLEDRMQLAWGKRQTYGTQFRVDSSGNVHLMPTNDSAHVDARREQVGLPPLKTSMCVARYVAQGFAKR